MNWFTRLFRRKLKPEPAPIRLKAYGDFIGRQGGRRRNRVHIYRQWFGYPMRLCDWSAQNIDSIERIVEVQGLNGPAKSVTLGARLDWAEATKDAVICKHCRAVARGKRVALMDGLGRRA